jgi:hypothetical protein
MIRFLFRMLGVLCLAVAFVAVVIDGTRSIAARELMVTDLQGSIGQVSDKMLASATAAAQDGPPVVSSLLALLLSQPTAICFGLLGIVLMLLGRRRHRRHVGFAT